MTVCDQYGIRDAVGGAGVERDVRVVAAVIGGRATGEQRGHRRGRGITREEIAVGEIVAGGLQHAIDRVVGYVDRDVAAVVLAEVHAPQRIAVDALVVALAGNAEVATDFGAFVVLLEDQVDDAGDGIGAIGRGAADGKVLDALDHRGRHHVEVDLDTRCARAEDRRRVAGDEAATIDQGQGAVAAQPEAVHEVHAHAET